MQKFGLQKGTRFPLGAIELEIVKEQASALGRAGKNLSLALEHYHGLNQHDPDATQARQALKQISSYVWELMLQRELLGFTEGNLDWLKDNYPIPEAAINSMGIR